MHAIRTSHHLSGGIYCVKLCVYDSKVGARQGDMEQQQHKFMLLWPLPLVFLFFSLLIQYLTFLLLQFDNFEQYLSAHHQWRCLAKRYTQNIHCKNYTQIIYQTTHFYLRWNSNYHRLFLGESERVNTKKWKNNNAFNL
jgi:hypothetical protein